MLDPRATFADMNERLDKLHDQIEAMSFDDLVCMIDRFNRETITEARERPMRCVIALSSVLIQAKMPQRQDGSRGRTAGAQACEGDYQGGS
jgi:hypothetical protein